MKKALDYQEFNKRIFGKTSKYCNMVIKYLQNPKENKDILYRGVNFFFDIKEAFLGKNDILIKEKKISNFNENLESLLFRKETKENFYNKIQEKIPLDGLFGINCLVSCGDKKRKHAHGLVVEKKGESLTFYFLDPEFSISKDPFSASITNGFVLNMNSEDTYNMKLLRLKTEKKDKHLNHLSGVYNFLKNLNIDALRVGEEKFLLYCETNNNGETEVMGKQKQLNIYQKAKLHSSGFVLKMFFDLIQAQEIGIINNNDRGGIEFTKKHACTHAEEIVLKNN